MTKLILIRGLPGSGKTTLGLLYTRYIQLETDMYWGPEYKFDITKIKEAHQWCQDTTKDHLKAGLDVVVSNTFTTKWEMLPYFDIAKELDIVPQVILCQGKYNSVHNVPAEVIYRMRERFEYDIADLFERLK